MERFFKGYGKILEVDLKNGYGEMDSLFVSGERFFVRRPRRHVRLWLGPNRAQPLRPARGSFVSFLFGLALSFLPPFFLNS